MANGRPRVRWTWNAVARWQLAFAWLPTASGRVLTRVYFGEGAPRAFYEPAAVANDVSAWGPRA